MSWIAGTGGLGLSLNTKGEMFMEGPARGCLAGLISWKLGGGVISTIIIFLLVFWLLGYVRC